MPAKTRLQNIYLRLRGIRLPIEKLLFKLIFAGTPVKDWETKKVKRILLIDGDEAHASPLALALQARRHKVDVFRSTEDAVASLRQEEPDVDVIVVSFDARRFEDWEALNKLTQIDLKSSPVRRIVCVSRSYQGATVRLDVERLGARLVYER